jgi:RNA polymerase sigma factor (sigma-70 family)
MADSDMELLREYQRTRSDDAFTTLARRHIDLIFSAAIRQVRSKELAEEITQAVFIELVRSAPKLRDDTILAAWLYQVTRRRAVDLIRRETRRRSREEAAAKDFNPMNDDLSRWRDLEPLLDEAMADLDEKERAAVILRFFQNQSLRDVGLALGVSEDTAQKRVSRALDRLRDLLAARGAVATSAVIAAGISGNAVQAAPATLLTGLTAGVAAQTALTTTLVMTTLQKIATITLLTAGIGTAVFEGLHATILSRQLQNLQSKDAAYAAQFQDLQNQRNALMARTSTLEQENEQLRRNAAELARLRAEVTRLAQENRERKPAEGFADIAMQWKEKEGKLRRLMDAQPAQRVPEMDLLGDRMWLDIARDADLDSNEGVRKAFSALRHAAKNNFVMDLSTALQKFTQEHNDQLPGTLAELKPYFKNPVTDAMLDQYQLDHSGRASDIPSGEWAVSEKSVVDPDYDRLWKIGPQGYRNDNPRHEELAAAMRELMRAYQAANPGRTPKAITDLLPFVKTPEQQAAFREFDDSTTPSP